MNLRLEQKKDVAATLLALEQKKYILIQNKEITPLTGGTDSLLLSEADLLQLIHTGQLNRSSLNRWEQAAIRHAVKSGLIIANKDKARFVKRMLGFVAAFFLCAAFFGNTMLTMEEKNAELDALLAPYEGKYDVDYDRLSPDEQIDLLKEQLELPELRRCLPILSGMMIGVLCGFMLFILPIITIVYMVFYLESR